MTAIESNSLPPKPQASDPVSEGAHITEPPASSKVIKESDKPKEALHQNQQEEKNKAFKEDQAFKDELKDFVLNKIPIVGYAIATAGHFVSALVHVSSGSSSKIKDFCDKTSLNISKVANVYNYLITTYRAFENQLGLDALSRALYVAFVPFADQEDFYLYSGFSSGLTNIEQPQKRLVSNPPKGNRKNIMEHIKVFPKIWKETLTGIFTKNSKIFCSRSKDEGHLMHLFAHGNFLGALLGLIAGRGSSPLKKIASIVRNVGSVGVDISMLNCSDASKKSGIAYISTALLDLVQAFSNNPVLQRVTNHISISMNNLANYFYTLGTKEAIEGDFSFNADKQEKPKPALTLVPPVTPDLAIAA